MFNLNIINKMTTQDWAKKEIEIACKRENPDWDGKTFDYGCSCYQSALKAYNSLCSDNHSGFSWSVTANILNRLTHKLPLTPITEEDFTEQNDNLSDDKQCPRMFSLFQKRNEDGSFSYRDIDRTICININKEIDIFSWGTADKIVDKIYPITLPYCPPVNKYKVYIEEFLADKNNGDYDTQGFLYLITPDGKRVDLNIYKTEKEDGFVDISLEEYNSLKEKSKKLCLE